MKVRRKSDPQHERRDLHDQSRLCGCRVRSDCSAFRWPRAGGEFLPNGPHDMRDHDAGRWLLRVPVPRHNRGWQRGSGPAAAQQHQRDGGGMRRQPKRAGLPSVAGTGVAFRCLGLSGEPVEVGLTEKVRALPTTAWPTPTRPWPVPRYFATVSAPRVFGRRQSGSRIFVTLPTERVWMPPAANWPLCRPRMSTPTRRPDDTGSVGSRFRSSRRHGSGRGICAKNLPGRTRPIAARTATRPARTQPASRSPARIADPCRRAVRAAR